MEVHKFSKFIHGCAVLLPEEVTYFIKFNFSSSFFFLLCMYFEKNLYEMKMSFCSDE